MDNFFRRQGSDMQQANGFSAFLRFFNSILHRLIGFFQTTEEDLEDAGIYPGNKRYK